MITGMNSQASIDYRRIAEAIKYISEHFRDQPSLDDVAAHVSLSPFHFQKLFTEWAGVSPKKFLQFTSIQYAKQLLQQKQASLFDTALETGLSGTGRLHDLFISIEGMTPGEFKNGGEHLEINYQFAESPFGDMLMASTPIGICHIAFYDDKAAAQEKLLAEFPNARFTENPNAEQVNAITSWMYQGLETLPLKLHVRGTPFQLKVWEALLKIPMGQLSTYGRLAEQIDNPDASRAVGTAIGSNPVAFLIPCHRVIRSSGQFGGYMWGPERKTALIGWEMARTHEH